MFDAALEHWALSQCIYQAQRIMLEFDEQQSSAQRPRQLHLSNSARGVYEQQSNSSPAYSAVARQHLFDTLRGRHQRFLRTCLAVGQLPLALDYIRLLPRNEQLFTALLKEAVTYCSLDEMHGILQVLSSIFTDGIVMSCTAISQDFLVYSRPDPLLVLCPLRYPCFDPVRKTIGWLSAGL